LLEEAVGGGFADHDLTVGVPVVEFHWSGVGHLASSVSIEKLTVQEKVDKAVLNLWLVNLSVVKGEDIPSVLPWEERGDFEVHSVVV